MEAWDGFTLRVKKNKQGLISIGIFRRTGGRSTSSWAPVPIPTSEPEVRAVVEFFIRHPNITGGVAFHTWAGVLLRPFDHLADSEMNAEDLWHYRRIGDKGTELTGYPAISVYEEFRYHPKQVIGGVFDWVYEHLGMYSWVVELWSPMREAGIDQLQVHRLVPRPSDQRRPEALPLERRQARRRRARRVEALRSSAARHASRSAAGTGSTRSAIRRCLSSSARSSGSRSGSSGRR